MKRHYLLLEDVYGLGHKGDLIEGNKVKPGYMRNFLSPKGKAVVADKGTLRMRERLQKEREEQAKLDKSEAEKLATLINGKEFSVNVKVDPDGHMYGSVGVSDLLKIFKDEIGVELDRHAIRLAKPFKSRGRFPINFVLKENVPAECHLVILGEGETELKIEELKTFGVDKNIRLDPEIKRLEEKLEKMKKELSKI